MNIKRPSRRVMIAAAVVLVVIAGYYGLRTVTGSSNGQLKASGTIETVTVNVSPELSGKVNQVLVDEGQTVKLGQPVLILDDTLLQGQRKVAQSALESAQAASQTAQNALDIAQAQYQTTLEAQLAQGRKARLTDWFSKDQQNFDQPNWYFTRQEQIQAMQDQIDQAKKAWDTAQANLTGVAQSLDKANFVAAEQRLLNARLAYLVTKDVNTKGQNSTDSKAPQGRYNKFHCGSNQGYQLPNNHLVNAYYSCVGDQNLSDTSQTLFNNAQTELDDAQRAYDALLSSQAADDMLQARAQVAVAQEQYYAALDRLSSLQIGDQAPSVTAAQGAVDQAKTNFQQSLKAVAQAQASLDLLDAQLGKLTVYAPMNGVVLTRSVEPGEYVQPGAAALTMGDITQLTITVYVPEDRYGEIRLGEQATVRVDSFAGQTFKAQVSNISNQAEFTPRNVQTAEGRSSTVYAIKLTVVDTQGKLKPGMPADVTFIPK
jgi:multidrug efflux pump subunit AcrA (membrane-fusion protein)